MNDDERTILDNSTAENTASNENSVSNPQSRQTKDKKAGWGEKAAYAAGAAVFGAGATLAGQAMAATPPENTQEPEAPKPEEIPSPEPENAIVATATGVRVAQVDDDASFSQAFADARAQVGPGGIFEWHGRVYATYYKEEWDNMSAAERHEFQANIDYSDVVPDGSTAPQHNDVAQHDTHHHHDDSSTHHSAPTHTTSHQQPAQGDNYQQVNDDGEVRVLDVAQVDYDQNGIPDDAALLEVNGHEIIIVDIDRDGIADVAISDLNGDNEPEFESLQGYNVEMPCQPSDDMYLANNDAPDYMNDADVGNYMA